MFDSFRKLIKRKDEAEKKREYLIDLIRKHTGNGHCVILGTSSGNFFMVVSPGNSKALE